jgi:hypothetical protein
MRRMEMKREEIRFKAKALGTKTRAVKKADLIRQIQKTEGNFNGFSSAKDYYDQWNCCFREDCVPSVKS